MFEKMIDKMIKKYGFEAQETLTFCYLVEDFKKGILTKEDVKQEFKEILERGM